MLLNLLSNTNVSEDIVLLNNSKEFTKKLSLYNIKYYVLRNKEIGHFQNKFLYLFDFLLNFYLFIKINSIIKNGSYTHLHVHGFPSVVFGYIIKKINSNIKILYTHHAYRHPPKYKFEYIIFKKLYSEYDKVTAVSDTVNTSLINAFNIENTITIYNCIGDSFFDNKVTELSNNINFKNNDYKFIQVGRFTEIKNHELVIRSLIKIDKILLRKIKIYFVGDGPLKSKMEILTKKYNLEDNIIFLGAIDYLEIPKIIKKCDFFIFPSENEGFGLSSVEGMSQGLPVLALNNDIMNEIVKNNGVLVEKNNFELGFRRIIDKKFDRSEIRNYSKKFKICKIKEQYIKLYKDV